jgi:hypothetical protein
MCLRELAKSDRDLCPVCPSVRQSAWNKAAATGRIFMKFDIRIYFGNLSRKLKFY